MCIRKRSIISQKSIDIWQTTIFLGNPEAVALGNQLGSDRNLRTGLLWAKHKAFIETVNHNGAKELEVEGQA
jgi:hypothetical protein